jgi:hypothetical protein
MREGVWWSRVVGEGARCVERVVVVLLQFLMRCAQ